MEKVIEIISVSEARARGLKRYFTGKPCPKGHVAERRTSNRACCECARIEVQNRASEDPERESMYRKSYYWRHREKNLAKGAKWRAKNQDRVDFLRRRYYENNKEKERAYVKEWTRNNRDKANATMAKRYAKLRSSIPKLRDDLIPIYQAEILAIYAEAQTAQQLTGERYDVDHIFPIAKGGVHAPWNLRVLLRRENQKKNAKWPRNEPTHVMWHGELMSRIIETTE